MIPERRDRVRAHSPSDANREIWKRIEASIRHHAAHPEKIAGRLAALDREWDVERVLETNAALISLAGIGLAAGHDRRWLVLPGAVAGFLLQHALHGWCPPIPIIRRLGVRTTHEIEIERMALKALRGDFDEVADAPYQARAAVDAAVAF